MVDGRSIQQRQLLGALRFNPPPLADDLQRPEHGKMQRGAGGGVALDRRLPSLARRKAATGSRNPLSVSERWPQLNRPSRPTSERTTSDTSTSPGRRRAQPTGGVHHRPVDVAAVGDRFAGVHADAHLDPRPGVLLGHGDGAPEGVDGAAEHHQHSVARPS